MMLRGMGSNLLLFVLFVIWGHIYAAGEALDVENNDAFPDTLRGVTLKEITVKRGKEHYSKRNNPAVNFVNRIRDARDLADPRRNDFYNYRKYERVTLGLNNVRKPDPSALDPSRKPKKLDFLWEHTDTNSISGLPVLPLSLKEKVADVMYRKEPHAEKEYVIGLRDVGVDEVINLDNMRVIMEDALREVDLYDNDIALLRYRFVSPLSPIAPDFYKYYLTDTTMVDGVRCVVLSFAPRNSATFGFLGRLYVEEDDSTMFVKKVSMNVSPSINLNFVKRLQINQTYEKGADGSRLKTLDDMNIDFEVIDGLPEVYARRTTSYGNHSFSPPSQENMSILEGLGSVLVADNAKDHTEEFWIAERQIEMSHSEKRMPELMRRFRSIPLYYYGEKYLRIFINGYVSLAPKDAPVDLGPLNTFVSYNSIEGLRLKAGGITTAHLSDRLFARGYVAYGMRDHRWKYSGELEWSFNRKKYHAKEFPVHSLLIGQRYDIDQLGQNYSYTNPDNMFLSLKRGHNHLVGYKRDSRLCYKLELRNNFSVEASARAVRMEHGPFMPFVTTYGKDLGHYNQLVFNLKLRYAPGEVFMQSKSSRRQINRDAPVFTLEHTFAPKGSLGAPWGVNRTEISFGKRFWLSAFGYANIIIKGGHLWSQSGFPDLLAPNANLSYTIQPESFALLNPLEFMNDSYFSWHLTYFAQGLLFNQIPVIKRWKLREVIGFSGWMGRLSKKNDPSVNFGSNLLQFPSGALATPMHGHPYMELSAGLDNLLRILRVEYVWRLTYRNTPGVDRWGVRFALHFSF